MEITPQTASIGTTAGRSGPEQSHADGRGQIRKVQSKEWSRRTGDRSGAGRISRTAADGSTAANAETWELRAMPATGLGVPRTGTGAAGWAGASLQQEGAEASAAWVAAMVPFASIFATAIMAIPWQHSRQWVVGAVPPYPDIAADDIAAYTGVAHRAITSTAATILPANLISLPAYAGPPRPVCDSHHTPAGLPHQREAESKDLPSSLPSRDVCPFRTILCLRRLVSCL